MSECLLVPESDIVVNACKAASKESGGRELATVERKPIVFVRSSLPEDQIGQIAASDSIVHGQGQNW